MLHPLSVPTLDEYHLDEMMRIISEAKEFNTALTINYYRDGFIEEVSGYIHDIKEVKQQLHV
ncbi:YolD-like family protein [Bacillus sp. SW14]|uniref:YolD-like family protein n=1 Tax=Bacillus sp. SW14 TaxID=3391618 RepID=UPI0039E4DB47